MGKRRSKIVIMMTPKGQHYADFIAKEVNLRGVPVGATILVDAKQYLKEKGFLPKETLIHSRTAGPGKTYRRLKALEKQGYKIINSPQTLKLTSDKFESCNFAIKNNIPCARTLKVKKKKAIELIKNKIKEWGKVIVKPRKSQGQGEFCFLFDKSNTNQTQKVLKIPSEELVIQEYIEYTKLSRVIVIDFKALKDAVFYDEPKKDWKCSVCLNPQIKLYKNPPKELFKLAEKIAKSINAEISFIDIFTTPNGFVLNEINSSCSLIFHERLSRVNVSGKIADYLIKQLNK